MKLRCIKNSKNHNDDVRVIGDACKDGSRVKYDDDDERVKWQNENAILL